MRDDQKPAIELTKDRTGRPLLIWANPPGAGVELRPAELLALARDLAEAARLAQQREPGMER